MTDDEEDFIPKKKPNAGWKKIEEYNLKRYVKKVKREWESEQRP
ncbi:MAG: hypothetical protein Q7J45_01130 [bacterium]|nr:hypothetical protein [bacterium]